MEVTKETKISEILEKCPEAAFILMEYGLMCATCSLAKHHGLEETKKLYGFEDKDIEEIVKKINKAIEENAN